MSALLTHSLWILTLYPLMGAVAWTIGGFFYRFFYKGYKKSFPFIPAGAEPLVTILIPAHNEEIMIEETIDYLMGQLLWANYEVLVCDDGSTDATPDILARLSYKYPKLRVLHIEANHGKAHAFNIGISFARGKYILSNDADTVPEPDAIRKYMSYFLGDENQNTAAVTANMDVQNRSLILEKSQTVEFSSIVGIIKRSQMGILGGMYAYSGANTMYRKAAIYDAGGFRQDRATEDISIAWDHQMAGWQAVFAPDIMFYMNVPSTLEMLYHQRRRWAKGGIEVFFTNLSKVLRHPISRLNQAIMLADQAGSMAWSFLYFIGTFLMIVRMIYLLFVGNINELIEYLNISFIFFSYMSVIGFWQLFAALLLDNHGKKMKYLLFAPAYMVWHWQMNTLTIITTFIPALSGILGFSGSGVWISPTRTKMNK